MKAPQEPDPTSRRSRRAAARLEQDVLGETAVPAEAYYGARTARALESLHISGVELRLYPHFIRALGMVKLAAARANFEFGRLSFELLQGIEGACQDLIAGRLRDEFRIDVFQDGAGSATNTNANEVIANRALELMGHAKGEYEYCDPYDHVNCWQAAADVYSLAVDVGMALGHVELVAEVKHLATALRGKRDGQQSRAMAQPHGEAAVPHELDAFATMLAEEVRALVAAQRVWREVRLGAAAQAGGATTDFANRCASHLSTISGLPIRLVDGRVDPMLNTRAFVLYSSSMKRLAVALSKICRGLRVLSAGGRRTSDAPFPSETSVSGPGAAAWDPVVSEVISMVCFRVIGDDLTVTLAAEAGQLQRNVFEPVIAACLLGSQTTCLNAARTLRVYCVEPIPVGPTAAPADTRHAGRAGELATEVMKAGRGIAELLEQQEALKADPVAPVYDGRATGRKRAPRRSGRD